VIKANLTGIEKTDLYFGDRVRVILEAVILNPSS
jgi:hypothetical protein